MKTKIVILFLFVVCCMFIQAQQAPPTPPSNITLTDNPNGGFQLSWSPEDRAIRYQVYMSVNGITPIMTGPSSASTTVNLNFGSGCTYTVYVVTVVAEGQSGLSKPITFKVP